MRQAAVTAHAVQRDGGVVGRGHGRAAAEDQLPLRDARHVVHGEDRFAGEALKQAVFHHLQRAAAAFFGRLEDQVQRAVEVAVLRQVVRGGQQHGGVAVVAAGVHHAVFAAGPGGAGGLGDRQGVHVGAQADGAVRCAALELPHHAGATQTGGDLVTPGAQLRRHQGGGATLLERQFRVAVDVAAQIDEGLQGLVTESFHEVAPGLGGPVLQFLSLPWHELCCMLGSGSCKVQCIEEH